MNHQINFKIRKQIFRNIFLTIALSIAFFVQIGVGQTVAYTGMTSVTCPAVPVATIAPSVPGLTFSQLSRGSGVTCSSASTGINGSAFNVSLVTALSSNKWYTLSITSDASVTFTVTSLSVVSQVSNATGSPSVDVQYSIGAGAKTSIGNFTPTTTSTAYLITPGSPISVSANQLLNIFFVPNNLTASGTTCRINNSTSITVVTTPFVGVNNPATFTALANSTSQINLASTANGNGDNIVVVSNGSGTFGTPTDGVAAPLSGNAFVGGVVVYNGPAASLVNHTGLTANTAYFYKTFSYDGSNNFSSGLTANATTLKDEPSEHASSFSCGTTTQTSIPLTWIDGAGIVVPDNYLIKWSAVSFAAIANPNDLFFEVDGPNSLNIAQGQQSAVINGLIPTSTYFFKIFSYTNSGSNVNYKTDGVISQTSCATQAGPILAWQFGTPASLGNEVTYSSTTSNINLNASSLSRGNGITPTPLGRGFSGNGWDVAATKASAIAGEEYYQFTVNASTGYSVSLSTLDARLRRSASGPIAYIWQYSKDGLIFTDIGTDISFTSSADGVDQSTINLTSISELQNVPATTTIIFRLYAWGGSSLTSTFAIGRFGTGITTNSLAIGGSVVPCTDPIAFTVSGGGAFCAGGAGVPIGLAGSESGISYQLFLGGVGIGLPAVGTGSSINFGNQNLAGTYSVVATAPLGCTTTMTNNAVVSINALPTAVISGDANICTGGSTNLTINFTGTAPWLYAINGGTPVSTSSNPETVSVSPVANTVYTITSLSDVNCSGSGTGSATVTVSFAVPAGGCSITSIPVSGCVTNVVSVSTNVVPGAESYTWSAPLGCLINGLASPQTTGSNTVSITLGTLPGNSSGWQICVFAANACGQTNTSCSWIRGSLSTPAAITGSTVACPNTGPDNYSTAAVSGASAYLWTITGDASVSGTGTTGAVTFGPTFTTGQLCVRALLPCGYQSAQRCMTIANGTPLLGSMIGTFTVCPGATNVAYSVPPSIGATSYTWTVPAGATITGGQGTNAITVTFGPTYTGSNICVFATSTCGIQSLLRCRTVASNKPNTPGNIVGASTGVCGQTISYSVAAVAGATSYTWSITGGAVFGTPNGSTSIDVVYPGGYTTGQLCVTANNGCGSSTARCTAIKGTPANPGVITGATTVCANDASVAYSIAAVAGATSYVWTLPTGATFVSGQGSVSIVIDYGVVGGAITVVASGSCGVSGTRTLAITMNCKLSSSTLPGATVNAYPNPVSTQLNVELDAIAAGTYSVELIDVAGRVIYATEMVATVGLNNNTIDVATFAKGVYTLSVKNAEGFAKQVRVAVQ